MDTNGDTKMLLLKDLCSRLPYGVIINTPSNIFYPSNREDVKLDSIFRIDNNFYLTEDSGWPIGECKPYLRPMSSMTEEEYENFRKTFKWFGRFDEPIFEWTYESYDWLNAHHFDFRNLIVRGLAIDCTDLNIY